MKVPGRRILTFPVVRPCDCASPAALLNALLASAQTISGHRSTEFVSHRQDARRIIRLVNIILMFLEEIFDRRTHLQEPATVLCLFELYVALEKICYLLEDCSREGSRLWLLMQSGRVNDEFQILVRSITTAIDVLPLASMDISLEVKESLGLAANQALKERITSDPVDEQAARKVFDILRTFENGIAPDLDDLKRVVEHLGIRSWKNCDDEIKFLEEEIEFDNLKGENRDAALLSNLMGLMIYSRTVIFTSFHSRHGRRRRRSSGPVRFSGNQGSVLGALNSDDFRCPISLELMMDPVTISTGQTYDFKSIQKWFKAGNLTCPKTGEKLKDTNFVRNLAIRKIIHDYCCERGIEFSDSSSRGNHDSGRTPFARSSAVAEAMRMVAASLSEKLLIGTEEGKNKAAYEIRLLLKSSVLNGSLIIEAGTVAGLLSMLSSADAYTQDNAMAALLNISKLCRGKTLIFESGGLDLIISVVWNGLKMEARQSAAATLFYLSSVDMYREEIGRSSEMAIPALVDLARKGTTRGKKNALVALFGLLLFNGNHQRALEVGIIPSLLNLIMSERGDLVDDSLGVLATLAETPQGSQAVLMSSSVIPLLVDTLQSSSSRAAREYIVSVLLSLCIHGEAEVISILQKIPSLMGSLYLVLTEGTSRAGKKASSLLNILHSWNNTEAFGMSPSAVPQEHVVRVQ